MNDRHRPLILIVDDDVETLKILGVVLGGTMWDIETAGDGTAALALLRDRRPDLVLLDMVMPGMSGWAFLRHLDELEAPPPVIIVSGRPTAARSLGPLERHVRAFVSKPFNMASLVQTCERVLETAHTEPPPRERRVEGRRAVCLRASLLSQSGASLAVGDLSNLSLSGAQLYLGVPLAVGQVLPLALALPDGGEPLRVVAEVRWREGGYLGLGFRDLSVDAVQRLKDAIAPSASA